MKCRLSFNTVNISNTADNSTALSWCSTADIIDWLIAKYGIYIENYNEIDT